MSGLNSLFPSKLTLTSVVLIVFGVYSGICTYLEYKKMKKQQAESRLRAERSNCVVMYANGSIAGWPPYQGRIKCGIDNIGLLFEPLIYFIDASTKTLDIAVMMLNVDKYIDALIRAKERGVVIRVITQCDRDSKQLAKLIDMVEVIKLYVPMEGQFARLLHYKYIIRDYGTFNECLCVGSMNFTVSGATDNFENLVFTQIHCITRSTKANFEHCLDLLDKDNQKLYKKAVLKNMRLI